LPYLACEVFTTDAWPIRAALFSDEGPIEHFSEKSAKILRQLKDEKQTKFLLLDKLVQFYE